MVEGAIVPLLVASDDDDEDSACCVVDLWFLNLGSVF